MASEHPPATRAPSAASEGAQGPVYALSLADLAAFLRRALVLVLALTAAGAAAAFGYLALTHRPVYVSDATVLVPRGGQGEGWHAISPQGYQRLLESQALAAETRRRLRAEGVKAPARLGRELRTRLLAERKQDAASGQLIEVQGRAASPAAAARLAAVWIGVFLERCEELAATVVAERLRYLERGMEDLQQEILPLRTERLELLGKLDRARAETAARWDRTLAAVDRTTREKRRAHEEETAALLDARRRELSLDSRHMRLEALAERVRVAAHEAAGSDDPGSPELKELEAAFEAADAELARDRRTVEGLHRDRAADLESRAAERTRERDHLLRKRDQELYEAAEAEEVALVELEERIRQQEKLLNDLRRSYSSVRLGQAEGEIVQLAAPPVEPEEPLPDRRGLKILLGALLGGALGLLIAVLREGTASIPLDPIDSRRPSS